MIFELIIYLVIGSVVSGIYVGMAHIIGEEREAVIAVSAIVLWPFMLLAGFVSLSLIKLNEVLK
jgi:hypothetical protein